MTFADRTRQICNQAAESLPKPWSDTARALADRLDGPLRVAIAGRVKAGKSTLLNALVGERLAPTDASECTRIVTWYEEAPTYSVQAQLRGGTRKSVTYRRNGALRLDLRDTQPDEISSLHVGWPSRRLHDLTLVDTPGLASINSDNSARTEDFLTSQDDRPDGADAVIYLLRHLHRNDVEFLDAFMDRRVIHASPANAIAVLSRADEIGGGRLDSLKSARRIAARYRTDETLGCLVATILPIAGLLAETGTTLREDEFAALSLLSSESSDVLDLMLATVDRFAEPESGPLTVELRRNLIDRFGMFGVRFALDALLRGEVRTAADLSAQLVRASGLDDLRAVIGERFLPRARVLRARSVLGGLRSLADAVRPDLGLHADWLESEIERIEISTTEMAAVRLLHLVISGQTRLGDDDAAEVRLLTAEQGHRRRLGVDPACSDEDLRRYCVERASRWHAMAADPLADPSTAEACDLAARLVEQIYFDTSVESEGDKI